MDGVFGSTGPKSCCGFPTSFCRGLVCDERLSVPMCSLCNYAEVQHFVRAQFHWIFFFLRIRCILAIQGESWFNLLKYRREKRETSPVPWIWMLFCHVREIRMLRVCYSENWGMWNDIIDGEVEGKFAKERSRAMALTQLLMDLQVEFSLCDHPAWTKGRASHLELCGHVAAEVVAQEWALKVNLALRHRSLISDFCSSARRCRVLLIRVSHGRIITLEQNNHPWAE